MRKIKVAIILLLIVNVNFVSAINHDTNVVGTVVLPSTGSSSSDKSCPTGAYYLGGQNTKLGGKDQLLGLRVSFYDMNGKQLGNTIDVWNKEKAASNNTWKAVDSDNVDAKLASANGFGYYTININHAHGLPSRIDYHENPSIFTLSGGAYYYYYDKTATGYQLMYTADGAVAMKTYLSTAEVVQRYMNIAKVTGIDSLNPDYTMVIEVLVRVVACGKGNLGGLYTAADFGSLVRKNTYINNFNLRCNVVKYLSLEEDGNIGTIEFKKTDLTAKKCGYGAGNYTPDEVTTSNFGVGMGFIHGWDVCGDRCNKGYYKIVYRTVDLTNPFLGIDGKKRTLDTNSNWYEKETTIDATIYSKTPVYSIKLTPAKIKAIRNDNKNIKYADIMAKYSATSKFKDSEFKKKFGL